MSLTFKAFLYERTWRGDPVEIRRFTVDQDVSSSYAYLLEKVVQVFPSLTTGNAILAWTDSDGDIVTISSDEELVEALDQFEGNVFRLYIRKRSSVDFSTPTSVPKPGQSDQDSPQGGTGAQKPPPDGPPPTSDTQGSFHPGVQCDGCSSSIYGTRFKCLVCRDYDLCSSCEGKGIHVDHNMVSIVDPWSYHPWGGFGYPPWAGCRGGFGAFQGRGGSCRGGRFGGGHRHQRHPQQPFPWFHGFGSGGTSCGGAQSTQQQQQEGNADKGSTEGQEPMDTEQRPGPSEEERKTFLRGVGEAVSSFLEPFGVKVDVGVLGGGKPKDPEPEETETSSAANAQDDVKVSDEVVEEALAQLTSMGYQDEGGWLRELVQAKGGDVAKVLDALHPTVEQV